MPAPRVDDIGSLDNDELRAQYFYPSGLARCWVRGNAISSIDGGATTDGTSGGLGNIGDRRLFHVLRGLADVIVVGAGTVRAENYAGAQMTVAQRRHRQDSGQSEIPPIAVVTRSGQLDRNLAVLTYTEVRPLVLTCRAAVPATRKQLGAAAEVLECSGADPAEVDPAAILATLAERRLTRVLAEGGPTLMGAFIEHDLVDELCLTFAPMLVGGSAPRIATGPSHVMTRMQPAHLLTDSDGYLYARYARAS